MRLIRSAVSLVFTEISTVVQTILFHGARSLARQVLREVAAKNPPSGQVRQVLQREGEILQRLQRLSASAPTAFRIRCHGDFHLGQVLWTGKDFTIIDFEGEPSRSLGWRRLKRPAAFDLADIIDRAEVRVSERGGRASLTQEPLTGCRVACVVKVRHLDCGLPI